MALSIRRQRNQPVKDTRPQWVKDLDLNRPKYEEILPLVQKFSKELLEKVLDAVNDPYAIVKPDMLVQAGFPLLVAQYLSYRHEEAPTMPGVHLQALIELTARTYGLNQFEQYLGRGKRAAQIAKDLREYIAKM